LLITKNIQPPRLKRGDEDQGEMKTKGEASLTAAQLDVLCHPKNPTLPPQQFTYTAFGPGEEAAPSTTKKCTYLQGEFGRKEKFSSHYWRESRPFFSLQGTGIPTPVVLSSQLLKRGGALDLRTVLTLWLVLRAPGRTAVLAHVRYRSEGVRQ